MFSLCFHHDLSSDPRTYVKMLDTMVYPCNASTGEADTRGSVKCSIFGDLWVSARPCFKGGRVVGLTPEVVLCFLHACAYTLFYIDLHTCKLAYMHISKHKLRRGLGNSGGKFQVC